MTANEYLKSIQDNFDGIEKNLDKLSKKEIDTMLNALAEGEDDVDFEREKREKILEESEEVEREYDTMYYPQVDGITPTVVAESCDDCISRQQVLDFFKDDVYVCNEVMNMPSVTPKPKTGHWIFKNDDYYNWLECSECGYGSEGEVKYGEDTPYCPNCGCRMEVN